MRIFTLCFLLLAAGYTANAQATLETFLNDAMSGGPSTSPQTMALQKNYNNPSASDTVAYSPRISVTCSVSNQQFSSVEGNAGIPGTTFGAASGSNNIVSGKGYFLPFYNFQSRSNFYTACSTCTPGTGIDATFINNVPQNAGFNIFNCADALINSSGTQLYALNARVQYSDLTFTFSRPVTNPVVHFTDIGAYTAYNVSSHDIWYTQGFATEFDMVTAGLSFTRLSGNSVFSVTSTVIKNTATHLGAPDIGDTPSGVSRFAASGSAVVNGTNITSFTVRMYVYGDGGTITTSGGSPTAAADGNIVRWATQGGFVPGGGTLNTESVAGDAVVISFSLEAPPPSVNIAGNVFNDINAGNVNNSTAAANAVPSGMFANLADASNNVVASTTVNTDGSFSFANITAATAYTVSISTTAGTVASAPPATAIPAGWVKTGEFNGTPNTGSDGTIDGISASFDASADVTNINFGIEQLPSPGSYTAASQPNPGSTINLPVPDFYWSGADPAGGTISSLRITTFPTNITSITINNVFYTAGTFPGSGVTVPTTSAGLPTQSITIDPVNGAITVSIPYKVTDNAGFESTTIGGVNMPVGTALPVVLTDFSGTLSNKKPDLRWTTSVEINSDYFAVERSADGIHFNAVATIPATQNASGSDYKYTDSLPIAGPNYYRLKMVDKDGSFKYSKTILVAVSNNSLPISIAPNPFNDAFNISVDLKTESDINIVVRDANGKTVYKKKAAGAAGRNSIPVANLARLPQGIYFISINTNNNSFHQKILKSR